MFPTGIFTWSTYGIDSKVPYYGTFGNSRRKSFGKRDLWAQTDSVEPQSWYKDVVAPVYQERCALRHDELDKLPLEKSPTSNSATVWNGKFAWINLTHTENSSLLTAHLSESAGGCGIPVKESEAEGVIFKDTKDTLY